MTWQTIVALLVALASLGTAVAALLRIGPDRQKVGAEVRHQDTDGAVVLSNAALAQMQAAIDKADRAEERLGIVEGRMDQLEQLARAHQRWDQQAVSVVRQLGGHLPPPPPLLPRTG